MRADPVRVRGPVGVRVRRVAIPGGWAAGAVVAAPGEEASGVGIEREPCGACAASGRRAAGRASGALCRRCIGTGGCFGVRVQEGFIGF